MKPDEGDWVRILDPVSSCGQEEINSPWVVLRTYDHYRFDEPGGDWGSDGESAWAQQDHDEYTGKIGEWYAIVYNMDYPAEEMSLASYECAVINRTLLLIP